MDINKSSFIVDTLESLNRCVILALRIRNRQRAQATEDLNNLVNNADRRREALDAYRFSLNNRRGT